MRTFFVFLGLVALCAALVPQSASAQNSNDYDPSGDTINGAGSSGGSSGWTMHYYPPTPFMDGFWYWEPPYSSPHDRDRDAVASEPSKSSTDDRGVFW